MTVPEEARDLEAIFARAWADARNTRIELPAVDVNQLLRERYDLDQPLTFTRAMLWDVEVRKAWRPDRYIPSVVQGGSARSWGGAMDADGSDVCRRASQQRLWLQPDIHGLVLEQCRLDFAAQAVTFIGSEELQGPEGSPLRASGEQPIFHVEHSVGGEPERPLSQWRVVHLTEGPDSRLEECFARIAENPWLPEFVEVYIRHDLGIGLARREPAS